MKAVIMAGGRGTRIASVRSDIPKPMIPVLGKPILSYGIDVLKRQGITDITLVIGYLGDAISDYYGDGSAYGVRISYVRETTPLGTAGGLYYLRGEVGDDFLLLNGDIIWDVDISRFLAFHKAHGAAATILTHPNSHPYDSGLVFTDRTSGRVTKWLHKEDERLWYHNRVNAGLHILSPRILNLFPRPEKRDLDREILRSLIPRGGLYAYDSPEYVKDMGTPDRLAQVEEDVKAGLVQERNLSRRQKAIFLDRDGTINRQNGFISRPEDLELLPGAAEAIRKINASGYLAIVITNQPVVARGECTMEGLDVIHQKMETLLGREGAFIDDLFFCPHHPDRGFPGEVKELKIDCDCRKPKPGLFYRARDRYNIDLSRSYMIGDSRRDEEAGRNAGCVPCRIGRPDYPGTLSGSSLLDIVGKILG